MDPAAEPRAAPLTATVQPAAAADAARAIARLPEREMRALGLRPGDLVSVTGRRRHVARVLPWPGPAPDSPVVALCASGRDNCGAGPGGAVALAPAALPEARALVLSCPGPLGPAARARLARRAAEALVDRPVCPGDRIPLDPGPRDRALTVAAVEPAGGGRVTAATRITLEAGAAARLPGIGGLATQIARILEMTELPLRRPDLFARLGIAPPRGVLLTGPPGTGKTLLARAVAEASEARFFPINGPEIVSKHYGDSEARLRELFRAAEKQAPAIVFIDEIDAIAPRRDAVSGEKQLERRVVAQLLTLMDGLAERGRVVVMAATNLAHMLDPALRRPGRFDREIAVPAPDTAAREEILELHLGAMPLAPEVSLPAIARRAHGYVGADLAALAREAGMAAIARSGVAGDPGSDDLLVTPADIEAAFAATGPSALRESRVELPGTRLDDVGGLAGAKRALTEAVLWPLAHPEPCRELGIAPPSGLLLAGPPGGGKTMLARALACESGMTFVPVRGARLLSQYLGEAERSISDLFSRARQAAPCLMFLDELDALAPARGRADAAMARIVAQLLVEIDGIEPLTGVVLLGATNRVEAIDPALLRPGRFDRVIEIARPDAADRAEILTLKGRRHPFAADVDPADLAAQTEGWTGAELEHLCQTAARHALRRRLGAGAEAGPAAVTAADFRGALAECRAAARNRGPDSTAPEGDRHDRQI